MSGSARETPAGEHAVRALLLQGSLRLGLALPASQIDRLMFYAQALLKWRRVYNLIGARTLREVITHHLLDSLSVVSAVEGRRVLDMGSGAGLPGLPVAVVRPQIRMVLLEANAKRTRFLEHAVRTLDLQNVEVVRERAENYNPPQRFDCIVSRALCSWPQFVTLAKPLLSETGQLLAMKGRFEQHEQQPDNDIEIVAIRALNVPGVPGKRCLVQGGRRA
ncbi:MAG: 16S rRNA (guanine(527)-N(7))-methyltransferase RsmG [Gammaproteobacteria bacterium]|nr:16S rRNA (guanine(527)-N(7))-methyltransferase RsmG [Gammaproteobacteria bacterium]